MRIIVCGGRNFVDVPMLWRGLDKINAETPGGIRCVIDGSSDDVTGPYKGADYWAHQWAAARDKPWERYNADWVAHGRAAGPIRNSEMLRLGKPDMVVAFPGGRGTADMVKQADAAGLPIRRFI